MAAATVAALVATLGAPAHAGAGPTPGAPGVGDTYYPDYGNGGYDVGHYDLKLKYRPKTDELFGTATITATATQQLSSFNLDFALDVASVTVNGKAATFSKALSHELVITPKNPLHNHEAMTVVVKYSGIPSSVKVNGFTSWKRTSDGAEAINEPEIAWWWYPSNDQPQDKATYDISVAVPDGTQVVSNGVMTGPPVTTGGWTAWNWTSAKPMNTYSAFVVMGQYDILQSTAPNGQPFVSAFSKNIQNAVTEANARAAVARTPEILAFEETQFGPYPFEAQGGVVGPVDGQGFALECQTRPVYGPGFFRNRVNTSVVAHENAHQWFGGSVSVHNWQDIWLNEGFATYAQWLWSEHEGQGTVQELFDATYASYPVDSAFWQVLPGNPGSDKQFDDAVYDRGAMALQQLRLAVGDKEFFTVLKGWTKHKQYKDGSIAEFRAYAERITETDLHAVFDTWLFTPGRPALAAPARAAVAPAQPASLVEIRESREH